MSSFVLVHGAWHGSWCWDRVTRSLEQAGHQVSAIDLPGRGGDQTPHRNLSLEVFADRICAAVNENPIPVVLVAHSLAGISASHAAEKCPENIRAIIFVTAYLASRGQSCQDVAASDVDSLVHGNILIDEDAGSFMLRDGAPLKEIFYGQCSEVDVENATERLVPEPLAHALSPISVSPQRFGTIPKTYIECTLDRTISIGHQRKMQQAVPCEQVHALQTDHSPFFSTPDELVQLLVKV